MSSTRPPLPSSALYVGEVVHQRTGTFDHRLRYRLWMVLVDLDELGWLQDRLRLLRRRFGPITLRTADHGDRSGRPLRLQIETHLAEAGIDIAGGPIRLLTMPRILGYGFNPISVFFCYKPDGALAALLYEVTNTFHERHSYLIAVPADQAGPVRQTVEKQLFVSPFMDRDLTYDFTVHPPGEAVSVVVAVRRGETPILTASFAGLRRPLTDGQLLRAFFTHPLLTWKVTWGIHWEALKVILKGARYRHRGPPPAHPVTVGPAPSPVGRALEPPGAKRSARRPDGRREASKGEGRLPEGPASPLPPPAHHPALRATFSQREKDQTVRAINSPPYRLRTPTL